MNRMIQSASLWWDGRSARERGLLAVMLVLILAVLAWLLVVRPAWAWRAAAAEHRAEAMATLARLEAGLASTAPTPAKTAMPLAEVEQAARAAAEAAGLTGVTLSVDEAGGIGFDAPGVGSAALFGWLSTLKAEYGVEIRDLTVIENADASLDAQGVLR
ncbi:type II secretion system protein GspM [Brevundimonas faecalis]|uniref:type II secretion system protein GspM n=1 Tax=Brevundimonas faecalis TaxID=947378 RepID=UPI003617F481